MKNTPDGFFEFMDAMNEDVHTYLESISDKELDDLVKKHGGPLKLFDFLLEKAMYEKRVDYLKAEILKSVNLILSNEVENYIIHKKAESIVELNGAAFQGFRDDRLGENMDNALAIFEISGKIELPFSENERLDRFIYEFKKPENEIVGEFMMSIEPPYLKLLMYYAKVKSFEDMKKIIKKYETITDDLENEYRRGERYQEFIHHYLTTTHSFSEFMSGISTEKTEELMKRFKINSVDSYIKLFLEKSYMYPMLININLNVFDMLITKFNLDTVEKIASFFENKNCRKLADINFNNSSWKNFTSVVNFLDIKSPEELSKILDEEELIGIITKSNPYNFEFLLNFCDKNLESVEKICSIEFIEENIENINFESLTYVFDSLGISGIERKNIIFDIISKSYDKNLSDTFSLFARALSKDFGDTNLKDFFIYNYTYYGNYKDIIVSLTRLLNDEGDNLKKCDFMRLKKLIKFMGGDITTYLAKEILTCENPEELVSSWDKTTKTFKDGKFDGKNKLHQNLEYKRFRKLTSHENIQKYVGNNSSIDSYFGIFTRERNEKDYSKNMKFEIECVAYEAKLLNDYILEVKKQADRIGKKVLVIPNLSYGYLPISPIYESLKEQGIEFIVGAKVGSTESHNNPSVIDSKLLKNFREKIINEQPVIIIVDGTKHIEARNGGDGKSARYPDSYQGYQNQVIAINDSIVLDYPEGEKPDEKKYFGKDEDNIEDLRENEVFDRTVKIYNKLNDGKPKELYDFAFWNTAGMDLIIRQNREKSGVIKPYNPVKMRGPTMIFCNVGVLDDQIPEEIKSKYENTNHSPAYFDDRGIVSFEFSYNEFGIDYTNNLESELKKVYGGKYEKKSIEDISVLIDFTRKNMGKGVGEGEGES
ncbi:MAG: hypothetical protein PHN31_04250 [Candidatus Gracilibacteria bacterium]|nr:hypothetical protein [Candidatus Gracilibacteria bacterium]